MQLDGTHVLVTGANRGIGRELARTLVAEGAIVHGGARDPESIVDEGVRPVRLDVTDPATIEAAAAALPEVRVVINNAGISTGSDPLDDDGVEQAHRELEVNYFGPLQVARAFAPALRTNAPGRVVNVLSALSWVAFPGTGNYSAAKAAAWNLTNALRVALAPTGVGVTGVHFGYVDTDMTAGVTAPKERPEDIARRIVDGILADQDEVLADATAEGVKASLAGPPMVPAAA